MKKITKVPEFLDCNRAVVFVSVLLLCACSEMDIDYCNRLKTTIESEQVRQHLIDWVDQFDKDPNQYESRIQYGYGMIPGIFYVENADIDWALLGFNGHAQVRILGENIAPDKINVVELAESFFFGERSRYGIIVKRGNHSSYGVDEGNLVSVEGRVAIFCPVEQP